MQNTFMQSRSTYYQRNLGKTLVRTSSRLASNITWFIVTQNDDDFSMVIPRPQPILVHEYSGGKGLFLNTDTILWSMGVFVLSTDETKPCWNDVDIISGFALCTSKSSSGFLVTEVVRNQSFSPGSPRYCWKSLLRAHEDNFLLWCWMPVERALSDFDVIWNNLE